MGLLQQFMDVYRYAVHPFVVTLGGGLALVYHEWREQSAPGRALWYRVGAVALVTVLAMVPLFAFLLATGRDAFRLDNAWYVDLTLGTGLLIAGATAWHLWSRFDWGTETRSAVTALLVTVVPYTALSLVWNVSGHVTFTLVPTLYLTLVDRSYWPLLAVPVLMVPNRPMVGMHTWPQSVAGLVLGLAGVLAARVVCERRLRRDAVGHSG